LIGDGHEVVVVDNCITGRRKNIEHLLDNPRFRFIEHDVSEPLSVPGNLDAVMHLASPASPDDFRRIPIPILRSGSYATHNLLELAREKNARFLLASTSEVYGDPPPEQHPQVETYFGNVNSIGTRSCYDEAKRYAEAATMTWHREYGLQTRIVRIFNTYGPRMRPEDGRVVTNFVSQALRGQPITLYGEGTQTRSFCFVSDLVDGILRLLWSDEIEPVNIGNPIERTVRELAEIVRGLIGSNSPIVTVPMPYQDDPKQRRPNISKAKRILGWEPVVPLEEGLARTIDYLRQEVSLG
jgi:dTDP-glucose 4,6-dehydratase